MNKPHYIVTTFLIAYTTGPLDMPRTTVLSVVLVTQPILFAICLGGGALSDRFGRRPIYIIGTLGAGLAAFPAFALIDQASTATLFFGVLLLGGFLFLYVGVQGAFFAELFDVRIRYTGASLSIGIATLVGERSLRPWAHCSPNSSGVSVSRCLFSASRWSLRAELGREKKLGPSARASASPRELACRSRTAVSASELRAMTGPARGMRRAWIRVGAVGSAAFREPEAATSHVSTAVHNAACLGVKLVVACRLDFLGFHNRLV